MRIHLEIDERELRALVLTKLQESFPMGGITAEDVRIEVKSKQNYKSEWESAAFRAVVEKS